MLEERVELTVKGRGRGKTRGTRGRAAISIVCVVSEVRGARQRRPGATALYVHPPAIPTAGARGTINRRKRQQGLPPVGPIFTTQPPSPFSPEVHGLGWTLLKQSMTKMTKDAFQFTKEWRKTRRRTWDCETNAARRGETRPDR